MPLFIPAAEAKFKLPFPKIYKIKVNLFELSKKKEAQKRETDMAHCRSTLEERSLLTGWMDVNCAADERKKIIMH